MISLIEKPSPNFDTRRSGAAPSMVILHYTGMKDADAALERLCDPASKVSAHYTVDEDGQIYRHVAEESRAWHAGESFWAGKTDLNSLSIGIEIVNPGHEHGYQSFPEKQIQSVSNLCQDILQRFDIEPEKVLAHSDVAPARKEDPGELFPWADLARQGVGIYPDPSDEDMVKATGLDVDRALMDFGFDPRVEKLERLLAFQRHFEPESFAEGEAGRASGRTKARIYALLAGRWLRGGGASW